MNNKNIITQGHDCFLVQARRLPGGWVFKRFIPAILASPSTVPPSAGTAGFGDNDASLEMAPNAFAGVYYSWKPYIIDPKIGNYPCHRDERVKKCCEITLTFILFLS